MRGVSHAAPQRSMADPPLADVTLDADLAADLASPP